VLDKVVEDIGLATSQKIAEALEGIHEKSQEEREGLVSWVKHNYDAYEKRLSEVHEELQGAIDDLDSRRQALYLEETQQIVEKLQELEVTAARLSEIKDGEKGEKGEQGLQGEPGLDRPLLEPVYLKDSDYPKSTLGLHNGGLWISTKDSVGDPQSDPHAWSCILDSMTEMSIDLQEDRSFKLSVRMATGKLIEDVFHIPFPEHKGIWEEGDYVKGDIVTKGSSFWQAMEDTSGEPPGNGWKQILSAPRGKQGPAGKSIVGPQGKPGRNGRDAEIPEGFLDELVKIASETKRFADGRSGAEAITSFRGYFDTTESYSSGDVINNDGSLYLCVSSTGPSNSIAQSSGSWELMLGVPKQSSGGWMLWRGSWEQKTYSVGHVVRDGDWTMVCVRETNDRAGPQAIGDPINGYSGLDPTTSDTAKQITQGVRYTSTNGAWLNAYRVYTITGNVYRVFSIQSNGEVNELALFEATSTGWQTFALTPILVLPGQEFSVVAVTQEPDPTPTTWQGDWNYTTPNNPAVPAAGTMIHANNELAVLRVAKTDNNAGDRSAELEALTIGDIIDGGNIRWVIQSVLDEGSFMAYSVAPAVQDSTDGIKTFTFETVTATPITYLSDTDYYLTNDNVDGLLGIDIDYNDIVPDDNAYGIDITVQAASASEDWEVVATSSGLSGSSVSTVKTQVVLDSANYTDQLPTGLGAPLQVVFGGADSNAFWSIDGAGFMTCLTDGTYTLRLKTQAGRRDTAGLAQIYTRVLINGTQVGDSAHVILSTDDFEIPQFYNTTISFTAGDTLVVQIVRDTDAVDSGGLYAGNPDVVGWNPSPSAKMEITRTYLE
jgi:hypothetical protein